MTGSSSSWFDRKWGASYSENERKGLDDYEMTADDSESLFLDDKVTSNDFQVRKKLRKTFKANNRINSECDFNRCDVAQYFRMNVDDDNR
jgi:predicted secreted hydrolase